MDGTPARGIFRLRNLIRNADQVTSLNMTAVKNCCPKMGTSLRFLFKLFCFRKHFSAILNSQSVLDGTFAADAAATSLFSIFCVQAL